ncbi:zinc-ribbon domain-containing protein [Microbacterium hominis]|uniref:Treble clef zinc finger domain-containing protein n=1 Tax=Microbacterium hominis TaxID=162426 RepID=A0A7D4U6G0_9MICO|nr:zinc-ribbon domain-containing protein [Microbacterium hominis]QKJ20945.1 hypothetical protein HQM25_17310 [Microbacterium hominis]
MAERIEAWWARRQFSRGLDVPYEVGTYRDAWASYPMLVRQYHPDLNAGIVLSQIPPAADVLLLWQCEAGHLFVATPSEQRSRPEGRRRRSAWCPECTSGARPGRGAPAAPMRAGRLAAPGAGAPGAEGVRAGAEGAPAWAEAVPAGAEGAPSGVRVDAPRGDGTRSAGSGEPVRAGRPMSPGVAPRRAGRARRTARPLCKKTPELPAGEPFVSACAPKPASAAEARVRAALFARLCVTPGMNAVRVNRPFFGHLEVWPDFLLPELRVAVEYDTVGRHGLEHVGPREETDRRKDRLLREAGWEVVRLRTGKLRPLGPHDLQLPTVGRGGIDRLVDELRSIRGPLMVDAYLV